MSPLLARRIHRLKRLALSWLIVTLIRGLLKTLRVTREGEALLGGGVVAFLHGEQLPLLLHLPAGERVTPISLSDDGELQTHVMSRFQVEAVRGSSSRGGLRVLRELYRLMQARPQLFTLIAVDGPRGPHAHVHPGAAHLATRLERPLWLCRARCDRAWRLKSWDRFVIPKPFSHVHITTTRVAQDDPIGAHQALSQALNDHEQGRSERRD